MIWNLKDHKGSWRGEGRSLFLGQSAINILAGMKPSVGGFFFPSKKNKLGFISRLTYQRIVKKCTVHLTKKGILKHSGWSLRGIRNGRARQIQQQHGLEVARVMLGHTHQSMTSHYVGQSAATADLIKALNIN
jgi:integrase